MNGSALFVHEALLHIFKHRPEQRGWRKCGNFDARRSNWPTMHTARQLLISRFQIFSRFANQTFLTPLPRHSKEVLPCRPHRQRKVAKPVQISAHATQSRRNGLHVLVTFNRVAIKLAPFVLHASLKNIRVSKEAFQTKTFRGRINEARMYVAALHMAN